jgi:hypothetical protein
MSGVLELTSTIRGVRCSISVQVAENDDPTALGTAPHARGFPVCRATIETSLTGYRAVMGWIQVVGTRAQQETSITFELDPLEIFAGVDTPFGTHGIAPTLFDAPSRRDRSVRRSWRAHSFLCVSVPQPMSRHLAAVAAFQWGFEMTPDEIAIVGPSRLGIDVWHGHVQLLAAAHPTWTFLPGDEVW